MHIRMFLSTVAVVLMSVPSLAQLRGVPEDFIAVAVPASNDVSTAGTVLCRSIGGRRRPNTRCSRECSVKGPSAVLDELRNMRPLGTIRTPDSPG